MFTTSSLPTSHIAAIKATADRLDNPDTITACADAYIHGPELIPHPTAVNLFNQWIDDEFYSFSLRAAVHWVPRIVPLTEAMSSLSAPVLPGEGRRILPVSTLNSEPVPGLMTERQNLKFRAVHDYMHHRLGVDDTWHGEVATTLGHIRTAPPQIWSIIASEILGQAAVRITAGSFPALRLAAGCLTCLAPL